MGEGGSDTRARVERPTYDVEGAGLDGCQVFVFDREFVFLFEGEHARAVVEQLLGDPQVPRAR